MGITSISTDIEVLVLFASVTSPQHPCEVLSKTSIVLHANYACLMFSARDLRGYVMMISSPNY